MKTKITILAMLSVGSLALTSCMKKPMACVDSGTKSGTVGQAVSFDASCSENAHHYQWDFGDGASGHTASTTHAYNSAGTYTAKIKALSKNSKKEDEKTITVTIN